MKYLHSSLLLILLYLPSSALTPFPYLYEMHHKFSPPHLPLPTKPMNMSTWMSHLPFHTPLNTLSIPGTHDTMAYRANRLPKFTTTQAGTLYQQLHAGVRFIDIRARHYRNTFEMHHGVVYLGTNFTFVVRTLHAFLTGPGSSEVVLMRLKDEQHAQGNTRTFVQTLEWYIDVHGDTMEMLTDLLWFPGDTSRRLPLLGESRGRVVVLRDYDAEGATYELGLPYTDEKRIKIQDHYQLYTYLDVIKKKWDLIINFWREWVSFFNSILDPPVPTTNPQDLPLLVNYLSGASLFCVPRNVATNEAWGINNRVQFFLRTAWETAWNAAFPAWREEFVELRGETLGVVVWDFINTRAARLVVSFNFRGVEGWDWSEVGFWTAGERWEFKEWN